MIKKELVTMAVSNVAGGNGPAKMTNLLEGQELPKKAGLAAFVELEPGSSIGYHQHIGEGEMYHILSGCGEYTENDVTTTVSAGMVTMVYDQDSHRLVNTGTQPLKLLAVIIKD